MSKTQIDTPHCTAEIFAADSHSIARPCGIPAAYLVQREVLAMLICGAAPESLASSVEIEAATPNVFSLRVKPGEALPRLGSPESVHRLILDAFEASDAAEVHDEGTWLIQRAKGKRPSVGKVAPNEATDGLSSLQSENTQEAEARRGAGGAGVQSSASSQGDV